VKPTGIDVKQGVLAVESDIHETAWWSDGAAPGDQTGSIIVAGHVDSAKAGAGAFFALKSAKPGTIVELTSADGKTRSYRVTQVRVMPKAQLPLDIWSQKGHIRLELVTCGGPFDAASGHYRDNIVVTTVPA
jgi:LPXTG-site transpeptidase (sortase) family protein